MMISGAVLSVLTVLAIASVEATSNFVVNDECRNAIQINDGILPYFNAENATFASFNPRDPITSCLSEGTTNDGNTMWYKYYSESAGVLIVNVTDSETLSNIALYTGSGCRSLTELFCLVDVTVMYYEVKKGQTYYIKTDDYEIEFYGPGQRNLTIKKERNYFSVINGITNRQYSLLYDLFNGGYNFDPVNTIDYSQLSTPSLSIAAKFTDTQAPIRSVYLTVDTHPFHTKCENQAPYTLFGDSGNDVFGSSFTLGQRKVTATAYSRPNCTGKIIGRLDQSFLVRGCRQVHYTLYESNTNKNVQEISNGTVIANPPCSLNIGVRFECGFIPKNVEFTLRDARTNTIEYMRNDTKAPYFMFGDDGKGNILPASIRQGNYILSVSIDGIVHKSVNFTNVGRCRSRPRNDTTFDIDLRFDNRESPLTTLFTYEQAQLFRPILKRLSSMIIGDKPEVNTTGFPKQVFCGELPPLIDDLFICTGQVEYTEDNDETLGFLLNSYVRESDGSHFSQPFCLTPRISNDCIHRD